jgi:hypothetical protein
MKEVLAFLGAILTIVALVPYITDIVRKKTKPNIVSWLTWTLLTSIATAAAFAAGEWQAAILTLANAIGTGTIVILGLKNGIAKFTLFDALCQVGALVALALWLIMDSPLVAIVGVVFIDFLGVLPTIKHSRQDPAEETWQTFFLSTIAPMFTIASLTVFHWENLLYPTYLLLADGLVMAIVITRRKQLGISLSRHSVHETLHE